MKPIAFITLFSLLCSFLLLASSLSGVAQEQALPKLLCHLTGKVNGEPIGLNILAVGVAPVTQSLEGKRFINIEPGCIMLEAVVKSIGENKLEIQLSRDDVRAMKAMGVSTKRVVVTFEPSDGALKGGSILAITPFDTKSSEPGGTDKPATHHEPEPEGTDKR